MNKQYCRVGAATSMTEERETIVLLEYQYQNFMAKASQADNQLAEFFESKALKIKKILENLVQ